MHRQSTLVFLFLLLIACRPAYKQLSRNYQFSNNGIPDYSSLNYWAAHPAKRDPSDSIPHPIISEYRYDSSVDVFFIHPTTFTDQEQLLWNADINAAELNAKTDYTSILFQASAFNEARVFAPRYRQANLKAYFSADTISSQQAFEMAYQDIKTAFEYYLTHFNQGHPIVIAAHSQGSSHGIRLLQDYFDQKPLMEKMVVAYLPGMNIPQNAFHEIKLCSEPKQTACFCGWRTFKRGHEPFMLPRYFHSYLTNPLSWTTGPELAPASLNIGAVLRNFNKVYPQVTDAEIHNNILWAKRPRFPGSFLYRAKNYHIGDINLFYLNIRQNMRERISAYKSSTIPVR